MLVVAEEDFIIRKTHPLTQTVEQQEEFSLAVMEEGIQPHRPLAQKMGLPTRVVVEEETQA
jgi:hypothetical protein